MSVPGFHAEAALVPAALPTGIPCIAACWSMALTAKGFDQSSSEEELEQIMRTCAALCGIEYTPALWAALNEYIFGTGAAGGGAAAEGGAAAGGIGAGGAAAIALAAAAVAWMLAKIGYSIWWEEMPLPPPPPAPPPTPSAGPYVPPPATVPCEKFLTAQPLTVTGYGSWGWLESGCAGADRSAYEKAAAVCNAMICGGFCRTGGPCHPDYVPVTLTRSAGWSLGLVCSSELTFHCRCAC